MNRRVGASFLIIVSVIVILGIGLARPTITKATQLDHAQLPSLSNNFNSSAWVATQAGFGPTATIANQTVDITFPTNSANDPSLRIFGAGLSSQCTVKGDFDAQVSFRLVNWTFSNGVRVGLASTPGVFFTGDFSATPPFAVERISFGSPTGDFPGLPREVYLTHFLDGVQGVTPTSDLSGSLRLTRSGGSETGYYLSSGNWVMIHTGSSTTEDIHLSIVAWSHDYAFSHTFVKVEYDKFALNQGSITCPTPVFSDSLNGNSINPAVWKTQITGTGPVVAAVNQSIVTTLPPNSQNDPIAQGFGGGLTSICLLGGDFDMQVNFRLLLWPQSSGVRVGLLIMDAPAPAVERVGWGPTEALGQPREVYLTHFADNPQGGTVTSDLSGTLRMVRTGSLLTGYYLHAGSWAQIHTGPTVNIGDVHFGFSAWSHNAIFSGQTVKVGFDNFVVNSGQFLCPSLRLSPTSGPVGTKVQIQASGFPPSRYGPNQVIVSFDDMFLGIASNANGNFSFTFNVPDAQPGLHFVKAIDESTGVSATASFTVTQVDSLSISLAVGTLYFPGDTAAIYTLATLTGSPLNSTTLQLQLTLLKPDGSNATLPSAFIGSGLFRATYTIPGNGPIGTYSIVARAHAPNAPDTTALTTFEVKLTWLSAQGPAVKTATVAVALTSMVALATALWRKNFFRTKISD
jgi:hypothetical protein